MRIAVALIAVLALAHTVPASAQNYGSVGGGPKLGELEIKAWQPIPKTKTAVQLSSDTRLGRELRRQLTARGFNVNRRSAPGQLAFENYWQGTPS